mmetsp:Transcript_2656/g.7895  ORF Transcript_2656/g.7895 Transcript_2656/m.7895 type:complete len:654 (-) Transcript_2656:3455-5416(-)
MAKSSRARRAVNSTALLLLLLAAFAAATALADAVSAVASEAPAAPISQSVKVSGPAVAKATQAAAGTLVPADELSSPGAALARQQGVPLASGFLAAHPQLGSEVPLGPPKEDGNRYNIDRAFVYNASAVIVGPAANSRSASVPFRPITKSTGFVRASGRRFILGKTTFYPAGTSWFNLLQLEAFSEAQIMQMMQVHWNNGVRVMRVFGHSEGFGTPTDSPLKNPIQPRIGTFNEAALRRFDYALYAAGKVGIRLIPTLTNFWSQFGGIQIYVDQLIGKGQPPELFYNNSKTRSAFRTWMRTITQRTNTRSKIKYANDPTIFAWELCNECHTTDNYEIKRGQVAGTLVYNWQREMAGYLKTGLKVKQMVANGNEGYRAKGRYDPYAPVTYPWRNWMNSGLKGEDFVRNSRNPYLDFISVHCYPFNLGIPSSQSFWVNDAVIGDRAALAVLANKPVLLEEYGAPRSYVTPRDQLFQPQLAAAAAFGYAGTVVWEVWPYFGNDVGYDFGYNQAGGRTVLSELDYQIRRSSTSSSPFKGKYNCACGDTAPPNLSCATVVKTGQCCTAQVQAGDVNNPYGYCVTSCKRCLCTGGTQFCRSTTPAPRSPPPPAPPPSSPPPPNPPSPASTTVPTVATAPPGAAGQVPTGGGAKSSSSGK